MKTVQKFNQNKSISKNFGNNYSKYSLYLHVLYLVLHKLNFLKFKTSPQMIYAFLYFFIYMCQSFLLVFHSSQDHLHLSYHQLHHLRSLEAFGSSLLQLFSLLLKHYFIYSYFSFSSFDFHCFIDFDLNFGCLNQLFLDVLRVDFPIMKFLIVPQFLPELPYLFIFSYFFPFYYN